MNIEFNYRYYIDEDKYETYHIQLNDYHKKCIATQLSEVGKVVQFAETQQQQGYFVALYLTYEAARYFNPQMAVCEKEDKDILAVAYSFNSAKELQYKSPNSTPYDNQHDFQFVESKHQMKEKIRHIQQAIVEGDTYQVNYTSRLTDNIYYPIEKLYEQLTATGNGNYTVLLDTDEVSVASISPELFFQKGHFKNEDNIIVSKPMKGTIPRGDNDKEDYNNYLQLQQSDKDKAENVMIVDLLRNDISRIAETGSIIVYKLFFIETYHTVYQMTSMVAGKLSTNVKLESILGAIFPCGSITGAPKINTMRFIKELEQRPRYIYCGTIGLLMPNDKMIFNIPIRTIEYRHQQAIYGVGAGITINSNPDSEVQEFQDKTKILERL
ncbi:anthranilate synthase component I family protein [Staphylococcus pasteuri]|uniref:chorismate-binding protein n=1 Tax=Staphylococcus pasteuri TaxID=45972 RepID=UPI001E48BEC7|nr:anthranilate synthase component I family protein [Staphylococcus pasteuri]